MTIRTTIAVATLTLLSAGASQAQNTPQVDARQEKQEQRIEQGKASGELTKRETRRLERQQAHIANAEARAKADGKVTAAERARLHHKQDKASANIAVQKHDAQDKK
jgi:hypothetical protein